MRRLQRRPRRSRRLRPSQVRQLHPRHPARARRRGGPSSSGGPASTRVPRAPRRRPPRTRGGTTARATSTRVEACASTSCWPAASLADRAVWSIVDLQRPQGQADAARTTPPSWWSSQEREQSVPLRRSATWLPPCATSSTGWSPPRRRSRCSPAAAEEIRAVARIVRALSRRCTSTPAWPSRRLADADDVGNDYEGPFDNSPLMGRANPLAPPLMLQVVDEHHVVGTADLRVGLRGTAGCVHGGYVAAAFDETARPGADQGRQPGHDRSAHRALPQPDAAAHRAARSTAGSIGSTAARRSARARSTPATACAPRPRACSSASTSPSWSPSPSSPTARSSAGAPPLPANLLRDRWSRSALARQVRLALGQVLAGAWRGRRRGWAGARPG